MKALRILQVTNRIPWPLNDGGNIAVYNLTRYLHRAGHHVVLAALNTRKHHQDPAVLKELSAVETVDIDTTVTAWGAFAALFSSLPYNVARFLSQEFSERLQYLLREQEFDLVQLEGSYMSLYLPAIRAVSEAPILLRSHNIEHQIWRRLSQREPNLLKKLYIRRMSSKIRQFELDHLQEYDAIVPIASQDADYYRAMGFEKPMRTINGGVDLQAFAPQLPLRADLRIGFLGSLEWLPNLEGLEWFLEDIWPQVLAACPEMTLHVAGKNPPDHLRELQVRGMTFHGMVPDAAAFMESCHFFIVPLHSGGGMRLKMVEAMAMGRCVISTTMGAEGIEGESGKDFILADEPADWVAKLTELAQNQQASLAIAEAGYKRAKEQFSLSAVGQQLEEFYEEVLR